MGVADAVGGWSDEGIDSGQYARELMQNSLLSTLRQSKRIINPKTILNDASMIQKPRVPPQLALLS